jgi:hypothetical protein
MSEELELLVHLTSPRPAEAALKRIASLFGISVEIADSGEPEVCVDGLLVYAVEPDDAEDRHVVLQIFDVNSNIALVFVDLSRADRAATVQVQQNIMRAVVMFATDPESEGVLIADYSPTSIIVAFKDGRLALNRDWDGCRLWPEVLAVIPPPQQMASLRGRD